MSVNRVVLIGHLGADPESRSLADGSPVCNLRIATSERWKDKGTGESKELTEWHRVVLYRHLAEIATRYLRKGSQIYVEGRLRTRKWTDGQGVERYTTEVESTELQILGKGNAAEGDMPRSVQNLVPGRPTTTNRNNGNLGIEHQGRTFDAGDDDIPF